MASVGAARGIGLAAWLVGMLLTPSLASALEAEPNCMGLGIGLLNPYFDIPWSADYAGHFSSFVERPSAAAYWGMETPEPTGSAETRLSLGKGLAVDAAGTPVTIFQAVSPPPIDPDFAFVVIDVSARVFVSSGAIAISLSNGPAPYAASAYPRTPFRTGETGKWVHIGEQVVLGPYSPGFDRISILSLTPDSKFLIGCITYIAVQRRTNEPYFPMKPASNDIPKPAGGSDSKRGVLPRL